jgi:hypothetical protein
LVIRTQVFFLTLTTAPFILKLNIFPPETNNFP